MLVYAPMLMRRFCHSLFKLRAHMHTQQPRYIHAKNRSNIIISVILVDEFLYFFDNLFNFLI